MTTPTAEGLKKHRAALRAAGLRPVQIWVPVEVQCKLFDEHPSVTVLPVTSEQVDAPLLRHTALQDAGNALQRPSQVMADLPADEDGRAVARVAVEDFCSQLDPAPTLMPH